MKNEIFGTGNKTDKGTEAQTYKQKKICNDDVGEKGS